MSGRGSGLRKPPDSRPCSTSEQDSIAVGKEGARVYGTVGLGSLATGRPAIGAPRRKRPAVHRRGDPRRAIAPTSQDARPARRHSPAEQCVYVWHEPRQFLPPLRVPDEGRSILPYSQNPRSAREDTQGRDGATVAADFGHELARPTVPYLRLALLAGHGDVVAVGEDGDDRLAHAGQGCYDALGADVPDAAAAVEAHGDDALTTGVDSAPGHRRGVALKAGQLNAARAPVHVPDASSAVCPRGQHAPAILKDDGP
mmetsp:Transcript_62620/g.186631  ORF Transcript_62620/g.186631 Transcript_62620/m.186631 type:complete len:256 (-) Transcript_62620:341-1108(-)